MTYRTKYRVSMVLVAVVLVGAVKGFAMLHQEVLFQENVWPGSLVLFGSVIAGMGITLAFYYYRARQNDTKTQQQIAVETLAALGKQRRAAKASTMPVMSGRKTRK
jgi:uncharacterized integral membrane protein